MAAAESVIGSRAWSSGKCCFRKALVESHCSPLVAGVMMADGLQLGPPATSARGWCCSYNQAQEEEEGRERLDGRGSHRPNITHACVRVCVAVNMMFWFLLFLCLFDMCDGNHTG